MLPLTYTRECATCGERHPRLAEKCLIVDPPDLNTFGGRLDHAIYTSGQLLKNIIADTGLSDSHLRALRRGRLDNPTIGTVRNLAQVLGVSPAWLAFGGQP